LLLPSVTPWSTSVWCGTCGISGMVWWKILPFCWDSVQALAKVSKAGHVGCPVAATDSWVFQGFFKACCILLL
jgi:hypothetical protein